MASLRRSGEPVADFADLDGWLQGLITQLSPQARRTLSRAIAARVRKNNQQRIAAQIAPDGSPFAPRLRRNQGRIRRKMFAKLRTSRWMKANGTADEAVIEFIGQAGRIARTHHEGLRDRVRPGGPEHQYAKRELLGLSDADLSLIESLVIEHIAR